MPNVRTSRGYSRLPDGQLGDFAGTVITGITDNKAPSPIRRSKSGISRR